MSALYDSPQTYNSSDTYDQYAQNRLIARDLFAFRNSDSVFNCQALTVGGTPLDITNFSLNCVIQEYQNGLKTYPASITMVYPVDGMYQINILNTAQLTRPRYVYEVFASSGQQKIKIQQGQLLME